MQRPLDALVPAILIVEDDADARAILAAILTRHGFVTVARRNGHDALAYLRDAPPPFLILSALRMPLVDGLELVRRLRASASWHHIPVVVMTDTPMRDRAGLGSTPILAKPLSVERVLSVVHRHAPRECRERGVGARSWRVDER